jgi:glutamyl-tRNA reductase
VVTLLGFILNEKEVQEVEYMLKREMEELLLDLSDPRIDEVVKRAMEEKYQIVFKIYKRFVPPKETMKYVLNRRNTQ